MNNNYSKIIRSNKFFYGLCKQETVATFKIGSNILSRNIEHNKFGLQTKNIQQKVQEQKMAPCGKI